MVKINKKQKQALILTSLLFGNVVITNCAMPNGAENETPSNSTQTNTVQPNETDTTQTGGTDNNTQTGDTNNTQTGDTNNTQTGDTNNNTQTGDTNNNTQTGGTDNTQTGGTDNTQTGGTDNNQTGTTTNKQDYTFTYSFQQDVSGIQDKNITFSIPKDSTFNLPDFQQMYSTLKSNNNDINIVFENLTSTKIVGQASADVFKAIIPIVIKTLQGNNANLSDVDVNNLPTFGNFGFQDGNYYGSQIDKLIDLYCAKGAVAKLGLANMTGGYFDTKEYLGGKNIYNDNVVVNEPYNISYDFAAISGVELKNVKISGGLSQNTYKNIGGLTNVIVESDLSDASVGSCYGMVDFRGLPPKKVPTSDGKTIISNTDFDYNVSLGAGTKRYDLSKFSDLGKFDKWMIMVSTNFIVQQPYYDKYKDDYDFTEKCGNTVMTEDNHTNQEWENAGNNGTNLSYAKQKPSVLQKLLLDNQKIYG